jgi:hypothetical protein
MASYFGSILERLDRCWSNIRTFAYRNRTVFEIFFIFLYSLEQVALIMLSFFMTQYITLIVSLFAVVVLATFSFHKLIMESRIKILENNVSDLEVYNQQITDEAQKINERYNEVIDSYKELNERFK